MKFQRGGSLTSDGYALFTLLAIFAILAVTFAFL